MRTEVTVITAMHESAQFARARHGVTVRGLIVVYKTLVNFTIRKTSNMARMTMQERGQAVGMLATGTSLRQVSFHCLFFNKIML